MPAIFSSLYQLPPNANAGAARIYSGPNAERRGQTVIRFATYTGAITFNASATVNDILRIAGGFLAGERLLRFSATRSADPDSANDFTFNLGWTSAPTAFASASNALQATTAFVLAADALASAAGAVEGDDLLLTPTAGAAEVTTVVHTFIVESYIP